MHVSAEFLEVFEEGRKLYELGDWALSCSALERANAIMRKNFLDTGWWEEKVRDSIVEKKRASGGSACAGADEWDDGACVALISYMSANGVEEAGGGGRKAGEGWKGMRPITKW